MSEAATQPAQTLDQRRAADALEKIRNLQARGENYYGHYVSYVSALPATIVMNGLGQALATLLSAAKGDPRDPHRILYDHIADWISTQIQPLSGPTDTLIDRLMQNRQDVYLQAQAEAMAYLNWLKQFARAYLKEKKEGEGA
jgi:CRISPR-associated protein Cmr5